MRWRVVDALLDSQIPVDSPTESRGSEDIPISVTQGDMANTTSDIDADALSCNSSSAHNFATALLSVEDDDIRCKWDMSLFKFAIAIRNSEVKRLPWFGNSSPAWMLILHTLKHRYRAKPFSPKDPRVSTDDWQKRIIRQNRVACSSACASLASVYDKAQRETAKKLSPDDDLTECVTS